MAGDIWMKFRHSLLPIPKDSIQVVCRDQKGWGPEPILPDLQARAFSHCLELPLRGQSTTEEKIRSFLLTRHEET
jgi:hypothetical protein